MSREKVTRQFHGGRREAIALGLVVVLVAALGVGQSLSLDRLSEAVDQNAVVLDRLSENREAIDEVVARIGTELERVIKQHDATTRETLADLLRRTSIVLERVGDIERVRVVVEPRPRAAEPAPKPGKGKRKGKA